MGTDLRRLLALFFLSLPMCAQTTLVSGNVKSLGAAAISGTVKVRYALQNCGGNQPTVSGVVVSVAPVDIPANASTGAFSGSVYANKDAGSGTNALSCGGTQSSYYIQTLVINGVSQASTATQVLLYNGSTFDPSSAPLCVAGIPTSCKLTGMTTTPLLSGSGYTQSLICHQNIAAVSWACVHNFGDPAVEVQVTDLTSHVIIPDSITLTDSNTVTIGFTVAQAGQAVVMRAGTLTIGTNLQNVLLANPTTNQAIVGGYSLNTGGPLTATAVTASSVNNVFSVDPASNTDLGAQVNTLYAACPSYGCTIKIPPKASGAKYDYSTGIAFTTSGKYPLLVCEAAGGTNSTSLGPVELNYTPTTATAALTLDYVPSTGSPLSSSHGIRGCAFINNSCTTKGGCGSSAIGISTGTTNAGSYEGVFENVSVTGFGTGYKNLNDASVQIHWTHPKFSDNTTAFLLSSITDLTLDAGQLAGNGTVFKTNTTTSTPDVQLFGTAIFNNTGLIFDATASSVIGTRLDGYGAHFENSPSDSANFISGKVDVHLYGGVVEDDNTVGTNNWFFSLSGEYFASHGVTYLCNRTCTEILLANSPLRGTIGGHDRTNGHFSNYVAGANAANIGVHISPGPSSVTAIADTFEWIKSPTVEVGTGGGFVIDGDGAPAGQALKSVCFSNASSSYEIFCSNNNDTFSKVPRVGVTNTWSAAQTFSTQLTSSLATGTAPLSIASTTPVTNLNSSLTTYNAAGTQQTNTHAVIGSASLSSASPSTVTVTLAGSAVFTSGASYKCALTNETTQANPVKITYTDGSHFVITGPNTVTDSISYSCLGN